MAAYAIRDLTADEIEEVVGGRTIDGTKVADGVIAVGGVMVAVAALPAEMAIGATIAVAVGAGLVVGGGTYLILSGLGFNNGHYTATGHVPGPYTNGYW